MKERTTGGIYVHVPFCVRKCRYCDFHSITDLGLRDRFVSALIREIRMEPAPVDARGNEVAFDSLYFGGGTPSLLSPDQIGAVLEALFARFSISEDTEITMEANPGTVTPASLAGYRATGVNRLNFGVQSFSAGELITLGRIHSESETLIAWKAARNAGFSNLGLDLIYGLPDQTKAEWDAQLDAAIRLDPEHLSLYLLSFEEGTPMTADLACGRLSAPDEAVVADLLVHTLTRLDKEGWPWYEVSNFAREAAFRSRHNRKYWNGNPYLGFGPAAHGFLSGVRQGNGADTPGYIERLESGNPPARSRESLSREDQRIEALYLALRTRNGIDVADFEGRFGGKFHSIYESVLEKWKTRLACSREHVALTPEGMVMLDAVTADFVSAI